MNTNPKAVAEFIAWISRLIEELPANIGLIYIEWNGCCNAAGNEDWIQFFAAGYERCRMRAFDPENPDDLGELSEWDWENPSSCVIPKAEIGTEDLNAFIERAASENSKLPELCISRDVQMAYGPHEGEVFLLPGCARVRGIDQKPSKRFCYELHGRLLANSIDDYDLGIFDEAPLLRHEKVTQPWPAEGIFFLLEENARPTDLLCSNRWMICSQRLTKLFTDNTEAVQIFPAPLYLHGPSGRERVEGYFVVNIYEKLDCIPDQYVKPPAYRGGPRTFNPSKGYKLQWPVIAGKNVFRLNYEYYRLLVSQKLRDEFDNLKITGVGWLKREVVDWPANDNKPSRL